MGQAELAVPFAAGNRNGWPNLFYVGIQTHSLISQLPLHHPQ